jgi:hypothetical protein
MVPLAPADLPLKERGGSAGFCGPRRLQIDDHDADDDRDDLVRKTPPAGLEKRPSLSAMRLPLCVAY